MRTRECLLDARDLIHDPAHWVRGASAVDYDGHEVTPSNPAACKWCATGAVMHSCEDVEVRAEAFNLLDEVAGTLGAPGAVLLNDTRPHDDVMIMFDLAIARTV